MNPQLHRFVVIAAMALSAIMVGIGAAYVTSMGMRLALALAAIVPLIVVWFWLQTPSETMSESIHRVRDAGPGGDRNAVRK